MKLRPEVREAVEKTLGTTTGVDAVSGGSVAATFRLRFASGDDVFLKVSDTVETIGAEARGLEMLGAAASGGVSVPEVVATGKVDGSGWLVLPWIETASARSSEWRGIGMGIAELHRWDTGRDWGLETDNWIGPLPQSNTPAGSWAEFWWTRRLEPQLRLLPEGGFAVASRDQWRRLEAMLPERLAAAADEPPSLVHGDLWNGNLLPDGDGCGWLIDPAAYRGHREVDLAMARLFGGFPPAFWDGYTNLYPLLPGFDTERRPIYQLYYLLVHVNLFGGGYVGRTEAVLQQALGSP